MPVVHLHPESQPSSESSSLHNSPPSPTTSDNHHDHRDSDSDSITTRHDRQHSHRSAEPQSPSPNSTATTIMSLYPMRLYSSERPPSPLALTSSIAPPSLMPMTASGSSSTPRMKPSANLKLSMLPSSNCTSTTSSGASSTTNTPPNYSAYSHSLSTQQKLQLHQREIINSATRANGIPPHLLSSGPMSPKLIPLGSPGGPVTPLMLEQERDGNYFAGHDVMVGYVAQTTGGRS